MSKKRKRGKGTYNTKPASGRVFYKWPPFEWGSPEFLLVAIGGCTVLFLTINYLVKVHQNIL